MPPYTKVARKPPRMAMRISGMNALLTAIALRLAAT